jgi:uncharacterized membrane protein YidH (DUF202 family)
VSLTDVVKEMTNGNPQAAWVRTAVMIIAFGIMLWFDPRIAYMQTQIAENAANVKIMDGQGTRHSSQGEIAITARVANNEQRLQKLEDRSEKIDAALSAILNRLPSQR